MFGPQPELSYALRQLCKRYNLRPNRLSSTTYALFPSLQAPAEPPKPVGLVEKDGVRFSLQRIEISSSRRINFGAGPDHTSPGRMSMSLAGVVLEGEAQRVAGVENVSAKDDLGNLLVSEFHPGYRWNGGGSGLFPDEWSAHVSLPAPHPRARKLAWVEGDLMVYKTYRQLKVEIPLPLPVGGARKEAYGVEVEVSRFVPALRRQRAIRWVYWSRGRPCRRTSGSQRTRRSLHKPASR